MLGLIPDFLFDIPITALSTPGGPGPLGLTMIDRNRVQDPVGGGLGCACAGPVAERLGFVAVEGRPLAGIFSTPTGMILGAVVGIGGGYWLLRKKGRNLKRITRRFRR